ncbi:MAG: GDP-mannose 4,6-dehydratase [Patescibacteria group bacterium]|jgi:GDPmannose 4,6-dehydratase|nr:GDP-mannose 4,6-dehydratase [Patescibacteria group bacterium]|tara:strand:- start:10935 stop:11996 length:1062 start_codon:yes stop_codon:yes gene_type:complete
MKKALITGVNGQDGSYLSELLLAKGYEVYGVVRRASTFNRWRLSKLYEHLFRRNKRFFLEYGDLSDSSSIIRIMKEIQPDEIYNLGAQSHVQVSFETPEYTANIDGVGVLRMIEAIRILGLEKKTKFYQASTSELYGKVVETPQSENTPFHPRSPYGVAKLYAYWIIKNYREAYNIFASNGILFNHESPRRGENFVSKKITQSLARIKLGLQESLVLGNLEAKRDWGYAKEYVEAMWLMLQQDKPGDFVIATGEMHTVREFVEEACKVLQIPLEWKGEGREEHGINTNTRKVIVRLDERYLRTTEVDILQGDATRANRILNWRPKVGFYELVEIMAKYDLEYNRAHPQGIFID